MKKKVLTILVIGIVAAALTACTRADNGSNAAAGSGSTTSGSGTIAQQNQQNPAGNNAGGTDTGSSFGTDAGAGGQGTADGGQTNHGGSSSGTVTGDSAAGTEAPQQPVTETPVYEENYEDDLPDAQNEDETEELEVYLDMDKPWDGTYVSDAGETLTVSVSDSNVSFSFANAGLSGTAQQDGNQAVYNGDDHHSIVLEYAGTDIMVTVVSEEDFDTSTSPLNGVYVRQ